ncbi:MAG: phage baseplate assembly protein [Myxococcales bacterium]|nr:phage baseplate assembly protein [Myxococcales bacterium]
MGALSRIRARLDAMVALATLRKVRHFAKSARCEIYIREGEDDDDAPYMQPFGLYFEPPEGSEVLAFAVGGLRVNTYVLAAQHPDHLPRHKPGGPCQGGLYTADGAWFVYVDGDGVTHVGAQHGSSEAVRDDYLQRELKKIQTTFESYAGQGEFVTPYTAGQTRASKVKLT